MLEIIPSIASANQTRIAQEIEQLTDTPRIHIDIEDGNFVSNITFGIKMIRHIRDCCDKQLDAHLMVTNPIFYIDDLAALGVTAAAVHWEKMDYPMAFINKIHQAGMKCGFALNPRTGIDDVIPYLDSLDYLLLITSEPDLADERLQLHCLNKIRRLRAANSSISIWADGGINADNYRQVTDSGANTIVMGRAIFEAQNPSKFIELLQEGYK